MTCLLQSPTITLLACLPLLAGCAGSHSMPDPAPMPPVLTEAAAPALAPAIDSARAMLRRATRDGAGVAVAVYRQGKPVWVEGIGTANGAGTTPVQPSRTLFRIYSVAKAMTATAGARLMEQGLLDPSAAVQRYVPSFPRKSAPITVMQLATHTSGIRHYASAEEAESQRHCATLEEALAIFEDDPLVQAPGTGESYSSWGYVLLSAVIAGAADAPFMDAMRRLVFDPAGMERVIRDNRPAGAPGTRAAFFEEQNGKLRPAPVVDNSCKWGAGGLLATAPDVARFGAAMLDGTLLSPHGLQLFLRGTDMYRVQGVGPGGTAFLVVDAGSGLAIAVLSNTSGDPIGPELKRAVAAIHEVFAFRAHAVEVAR